MHPKISTLLGHEHVAKLQYVLAFNLLEAMMEVKILESVLLQIVDNTNGNMTWCS
jgi:hypothetical protein